MTKEEIYDEQIAPLMAKIIEICHEHKIANVCSFSLDAGLLCTTCMTSEGFDPPDEFLQCVSLLYSQSSPTMVNVRDGKGNIVESTAIL